MNSSGSRRETLAPERSITMSTPGDAIALVSGPPDPGRPAPTEGPSRRVECRPVPDIDQRDPDEVAEPP